MDLQQFQMHLKHCFSFSTTSFVGCPLAFAENSIPATVRIDTEIVCSIDFKDDTNPNTHTYKIKRWPSPNIRITKWNFHLFAFEKFALQNVRYSAAVEISVSNRARERKLIKSSAKCAQNEHFLYMFHFVPRIRSMQCDCECSKHVAYEELVS